MSWLYSGNVTYDGTISSDGTTLNLSSEYTNVRAGDLVVAVVGIGYGGYTISGTGDWAEIVHTDYTDRCSQTIFYKQVDEDDIDQDFTWYSSTSYAGNVTYIVYRPRTNSTVTVTSFDVATIRATYIISDAVVLEDDRSFYVGVQTTDGAFNNTYYYMYEGPEYSTYSEAELRKRVYDFPTTHLYDFATLNTTTSGMDYKLRCRGNYDENILTLIAFSHSDSEGEDPGTGYPNNVFGVESYYINKVFGIDNADISKVFGV